MAKKSGSKKSEKDAPVPVEKPKAPKPYQFRVSARCLQRVVSLAHTLESEARLRFDPSSGLNLTVVDPSSVSMVGGNLPEIQVSPMPETGTTVEVGIDLERVSSFLVGKDGSDVAARFEYPWPLPKKPVQSPRVRWMTASEVVEHTAIDPASISDPRVPKVEPPVSIRVPIAPVREALQSLKMVTDHVEFRVLGSRFGVFSDAGDTRFARAIEGTEAKGQIRGVMYPLDFLLSFFVGAHLKGVRTVEIAFGPEYPLRVRFEADGGSFWFLLAPRVDEDVEPSTGLPDDGSDWPPVAAQFEEDADGPSWKMGEDW